MPVHMRVIPREDGGVGIVTINTDGRRAEDETDRECFERIYADHMAKSAEANPELVDRPVHAVTAPQLPPYTAPCDDGCGQAHNVRNQWVWDGKRVKRDPSRRNTPAEIDHLRAAENAELDKEQPDPIRLARIQRALRQFGQATLRKGQLPEAATVAGLVGPPP